MISRAQTVAFQGVEACPVEVQCAVAPGLPAFSIVGLPDKAVSEARDRVRSALAVMSIALPSKRITINLSPADLPKEGSHFDLPIAVALLAALEILPPRRPMRPSRLESCRWTERWLQSPAHCPQPSPPRSRTARSYARKGPARRPLGLRPQQSSARPPCRN